ncbi:hypothetical protein CsSME_00050544 [Camellia sinensis var. sinensis]
MRASCLESVSSKRHNGAPFGDGREVVEVAARQNALDVYYSKGCNNQSSDNKIYMQHDGFINKFNLGRHQQFIFSSIHKINKQQYVALFYATAFNSRKESVHKVQNVKSIIRQIYMV